MRNHVSPTGKRPRTRSWLAACACLCLAGCSMAPTKPAPLPPNLVQSCEALRRVPAEHARTEPEPSAQSADIVGALNLVPELWAAFRRLNSRMQAIIDWDAAPRK